MLAEQKAAPRGNHSCWANQEPIVALASKEGGSLVGKEAGGEDMKRNGAVHTRGC